MLGETAHIQPFGVGAVEKGRHEFRHASGRCLSVTFTFQYQQSMMLEAARRALGILRRRHGIRLTGQQQRRHLAVQRCMQIGIQGPSRPHLADFREGIKLIGTLDRKSVV